MVETGHTGRPTERQRAVGLGAGDCWGGRGQVTWWEEGLGSEESFGLEERPGGEGVACVGEGEGCLPGPGRVGVQAPWRPQSLDWALGEKPKPVGPPPSQSLRAKKPTTFTTAGG